MRLTETTDATKQAFKNARVRVVGWRLPLEEAKRIASMDEPEIVLIERPTHIKVRIIKPKSNKAESELTLTLKP